MPEIFQRLTPITKGSKWFDIKYHNFLYPEMGIGLNYLMKDRKTGELLTHENGDERVFAKTIKFSQGVFVPTYEEECKAVEATAHFKIGRIQKVPLSTFSPLPTVMNQTLGIKSTITPPTPVGQKSDDEPVIINNDDESILSKRKG